MKVIIGITIWDDDNQLWETKVGLDGKNMTLLYSVWGKTATDSQTKAEQIKCFLEQKLF